MLSLPWMAEHFGRKPTHEGQLKVLTSATGSGVDRELPAGRLRRGDRPDHNSTATKYIGSVAEPSRREPDRPGRGADLAAVLTDWLLSKAERANPQTVLDDPHPGQQAWSVGNHVRPLVHGATYFAELEECIEETRSGDLIMFTDWRGDPDEQLTEDPGSTMVRLLGAADRRGVTSEA